MSDMPTSGAPTASDHGCKALVATMRDRASPETDSAAKAGAYHMPGDYAETCGKQLVHIDFASNLERQRDEARKERDKAINRQLSCEAAIVEYEKLFGHVPHEQLLLNMKNTLAKLAKCREAFKSLGENLVQFSEPRGQDAGKKVLATLNATA